MTAWRAKARRKSAAATTPCWPSWNASAACWACWWAAPCCWRPCWPPASAFYCRARCAASRRPSSAWAKSATTSAIVVGGPADTRRLGQQLDWLRQRLADLDADKERFLRHISHELKTPLAALREGVALLEDEVAGKLSDGQREIAGILQQNTASLQNQIEDLLRYNTAAFDAQHLAHSKVDLLVLLQDVVAGQRLQWLARRLTVEVQGESADRAGRPRQAGHRPGQPAVECRALQPGRRHRARSACPAKAGRVCIDCIDEGAGVAPEDAERIFEPFYQGVRQAAGARNGNGIGLSIVREYIAAHDGSVTLLPRQAGAHFRIELPL